MSNGQRVVKHPYNKTIIKDGMIVRLRKDGRIKSVIGPWKPKVKENNG